MGFVNTVMLKKQFLMYLLNAVSMKKRGKNDRRIKNKWNSGSKFVRKWSIEVNSKAFYDFIREMGLINRK